MLRLRLDDPLDAVAVHGGGGLLGVLCVPFFMVANLEVDIYPTIIVACPSVQKRFDENTCMPSI